MGKVSITYSKIKDASKSAQKASDYYEDFSSELSKSVYNKLNINYGSDSKGYIHNAKNVVSNKVKDLNSKKKKYADLSTSLYNLKTTVENCESNAKKSVTKIATDELELKNRKWYQKVGDWIYGTVCVDIINSNPITKGLGNIIKSGLDYVDYGFDKAVDWFKHGDGKYYLNITLSVLGDIAAIAGTISAIALCAGATAVSGGAATPLLIAAIASGIGTVMTVVDSGFSIYNNIKALKISKNSSDPGRARYYGDIDGVSSSIGKYDMGGKKANKIWGYVGTGYDVTHTAADVTAVVTGSVGAAGLSETKVVDASGRVSIDVKYDPSKVKTNYGNYIKEKFGMRQIDGKWKFDAKYAFKKDTVGTTKRIDILKGKATRDGLGMSQKQYKTYKKVEKIIKTPKKIKGKVDNVEKITHVISKKDDVNNIKDAYKKVIKPVMKIAGDSGVNITSPISSINDTVIKIIDTGLNIAS